MTVIFVPACKRVVGHSLRGTTLLAIATAIPSAATLLHQQFGKRRCCVGFDG